MRWWVILLLLAGCTTAPPKFSACPPAPLTPAPAPKKATAKMISDLEIRVEIAREAERARGDACAEAVRERDLWMSRFVK